MNIESKTNYYENLVKNKIKCRKVVLCDEEEFVNAMPDYLIRFRKDLVDLHKGFTERDEQNLKELEKVNQDPSLIFQNVDLMWRLQKKRELSKSTSEEYNNFMQQKLDEEINERIDALVDIQHRERRRKQKMLLS